MSRARTNKRKQWKKEKQEARYAAISATELTEKYWDFMDGMDASVSGIPKDVVTAQRVLEEVKQVREASRVETLVEATALVAELVLDALKDSKLWDAYYEYNLSEYVVNVPEHVYKAAGFAIKITANNYISITHYPEVVVDDTADLITDADKVEALLNWIYEGGTFPLLKENVEG